MTYRGTERARKISVSLKARSAALAASSTKVCPHCKLELPRTVFKIKPNGQSEPYCPPCKTIRTVNGRRLRLATNPDARALQTKRNRKSALLRYHGITVEQYEQMFSAQNGVCAVCKTASLQRGRANLDIDHCHATNVIRGLLCQRCNRAVGLLGDDAGLLRRAADYLETSRWPEIVRDPTKHTARNHQSVGCRVALGLDELAVAPAVDMRGLVEFDLSDLGGESGE